MCKFSHQYSQLLQNAIQNHESRLLPSSQFRLSRGSLPTQIPKNTELDHGYGGNVRVIPFGIFEKNLFICRKEKRRKMNESKKYNLIEDETPVVKESSSVVYQITNPNPINENYDRRRENLARAISGEELLNRLRPRIKSLFE